MSTNELSVDRNPVVIAAEINQIKDQTRRMVLYNSIEIGKRLVEAKEVVPHGEWGNWLEQSVEYSHSTANNLMKIYEEYGSEQAALFGGTADSEAIASLPYTKALALMNIPSYEREKFVEENNVHELSTRELDKIIKDKRELEEKLKVFENEAAKHQDLELKLSEYDRKVKSLETKLEEAEQNDNNKELERLQKEVTAAKNEVDKYKKEKKKLEDKLRNQPIDTPEIIERVPEAVEQELEKLRKQVENSSSGEAEVKFKYLFESLADNFKSILESLNDIQDDQTKEKYKNAIKGLADKMVSHL